MVTIKAIGSAEDNFTVGYVEYLGISPQSKLTDNNAVKSSIE